jgi:hypothetical protein
MEWFDLGREMVPKQVLSKLVGFSKWVFRLVVVMVRLKSLASTLTAAQTWQSLSWSSSSSHLPSKSAESRKQPVSE